MLDSLRGLAALVVLLHHACTLFPRTLGAQNSGAFHALLLQISRFNTEAVLLFFVLSGFSIRLSIEPHGLGDRARLVRYAERRLLRILPLYGFALVISGMVAAWLAPVPAAAGAWTTLLGNVLFLQTAPGVKGMWFLPYAGNGALWSLSFEMFYYAAFPLLVRAIAGHGARLAAVLFATAIGQLLSERWPCPFTLFLGVSVVWYLGVELAELYLFGYTALPWAAALSLTTLLGATQLGSRALQFYGLWVGSLLFLAGAALITLAARLRPLARSLDRPLLTPLARVGDLSFALYLLHLPVLRAALAVASDCVLALVMGIGVSFVLAHISERAALRLMKLRARTDAGERTLAVAVGRQPRLTER